MNLIHLVIFSIAFVLATTDQQSFIVGGRQGNPGAEIVLTKKALDYVCLTAGDLMNDMIKTVVIKDLKFANSLTEVEIKNVRMINFQPAQFFYQLKPQDRVLWGFRNLGFDLNSEIHLSFIDWDGHSQLHADKINLDISAQLSVTSSGQPIFAEVCCETKAHGLGFERISGGWIGHILDMNGIKSNINNFLTGHFEDALCKKAIHFILNDMNRKLSTFQTKRTFNYDLQLDLSLLSPPLVENQRLRTIMKGEFDHWFWTPAATHFFPHVLDVNIDETRMINVFISDYMLNSFLFIAFKSGVFDVTHENKEYLKTNCENGACLTDYFPLVVRKYPDRSASLQITWTEPAVAVVKTEKFTLHSTGLFRLIMRKNGQSEIEAVSAKFKTVLDTTLSFESNNLVGGIEVQSINVSEFNNTVGMTFAQLNRFVNDMKTYLSVRWKADQERFPVVLTAGVSLVNPTLRLGNRTIQLYADFVYNKISPLEYANKPLLTAEQVRSVDGSLRDVNTPMKNKWQKLFEDLGILSEL